MRWFRRRREEEPGPDPAPSTPASNPSHTRASPSRISDWRSYDDVAADYARVHVPQTAAVAKDLLELADVAPSMRVLDVGTGTGHTLAVVDASVGQAGVAVGVDSSVGMLRAGPRRRVAAAEVINLPFRNETFDVAVASFALPYFTKLETSLFDVRRILKNRGRLAVAVWGADEDDLSKTWRTLVEETIGRDILKAGMKDEAPWAEHLSDRARLETTLRDAGFRPVSVERRRYRFAVSREDYIIGHEVEAMGRYAKAMLGERLWPSFQNRVRALFAERFPEQLVDFRDVLLAVGTKPQPIG